MSLDRPTSDPDTQPIVKAGLGERQRAAIWLLGLAIGAVLLVVIMVSVLGSSGGSSGPRANSIPAGPAVTVTGGAPPSTATSPSRQQPKSSSPTAPSNRAVSCPSQEPCALPDDIGNVVAALNAYRTSHGQTRVTGKVTPAAQTCAVSSGNDCSGGFFWEPVGRSGEQVIQKITAGSHGDELLAPNLGRVQVGWAYIPASHSFECALIINR